MWCSLTSGHEEGSTTLNPEFWSLFTCLQVNAQHERVSTDAALSVRVVVARALVNASWGLKPLGDRLKVEHRHLADQLHDLGFHQALLLEVPFGTLQVETCDESTIFDDFRNISNCLLCGNEIKLKSVN